jgi:hypothetical protein
MKGFVRILESIVASVILLSSVSFFFLPALEESKWDSTLLQTRTEDSLATLVKSGKMNEFLMVSDIRQLNDTFKSLLPENVEFSVVVKGIPSPEIRIGCLNCSDVEVNKLKNLLGLLEYNYKNRVVKILEPKKINFSGVDSDTDVIVSFDFEIINATPNDAANFMKSGGGLLLIGSFLEDNFGLEWCAVCTGPEPGEFYRFGEPDKISFKIANYYSNVSDVSVFDPNFNSENAFFFDNTGINRISVDENTIITSSDMTRSFAKVNEMPGIRTAWISTSTTGNLENIKNLTKSIVMWLGSDSYTLDPPYKKVSSRPLKVYEYMGVLDGFEPFKINIIMWRIIY